MKKYIILAVIVVLSFVSVASANSPVIDPGISHYVFSYNLSLGAFDDSVAQLQTRLIGMGIDIPAISSGAVAKGYFGVQTKRAVVQYQVQNNLPSTGFVGPLTRAKLNGNASGNHAPVVNGVAGPATLTVSQTGTWTVTATDPENNQLSYSVDWGDANLGGGDTCLNGGPCPLPNATTLQASFVQGTTFTHAYTMSGTYTVTFTIRDSVNNQTQSTITVLVTDTTIQPNTVTVLTPNGGEGWVINTDQTISWRWNIDPRASYSRNTKVDIYLQEMVNDCPVGMMCPAIYRIPPAPIVLDKNILITNSYSWIVGTDIVNNPIHGGLYRVKVCFAGTENCDMSDASFTLVDAAAAR